ncbi:helix-turn-helix transcriptional regulator [Streptomyces alkaliterrae]|uniref:WYL domain-containing protein n=1 Tax=Streptomyces alkaliterrae TaxID=2213162 RepID=A0A5P0YUR1_9ACTN|nr:WYL domain-containing protein [Streptomyces alkaliterrae]MBB1255292.1 WYL domain-containing protein [Streptomyces alkaliterrae]MBB1260520.1 WYL domain-containing protein [Streptomyces alkaliterrae]MQS04035.1 WYL domain-containing protein [Streptomyces alkaliterrae]
MRAARLIRLVLLLQHRRAMTAGELAAELEVSERTVARDVAALSEAGIPVYADRGRAGGYRLIGGYRTRLTGMGRTEAELLFLSGVPGALRELGLADSASAARLKVTAALSPELSDAQDTAAQRFHLDAPSWWREPEAPPLLPALAEAVWDDLRVTIGYLRGRRGDAGTREVEREIDPHGLILKAGVWYLAARVGEDFRIYRVERLTRLATGDRRFDRDPDFDLAAFWADHATAFARSLLRTDVLLRLTEAGARLLPHLHGNREVVAEALAAARPDDSGRLVCRLPVESVEVAYSQLLGLGPECEVLEPAALRELLARAAAATAELYRATPPDAGADAQR